MVAGRRICNLRRSGYERARNSACFRKTVTSVNVVEIPGLFEVAIGQAARGGSWSGSASVVASSFMASSCM